MSKSMALFLLIVNVVFFILNTIFLIIGLWPTINFIAALFSLGGAAASYQLYIDEK